MSKACVHLSAQYFLNHRLEPDEVRRQMREFAAKGFQGVFAHARQGLLTPYMSKEWWDVIDIIVEECAACGMKFQIWDEDYFPSALAGGRIVGAHPELAGRSLNFSISAFDACDSIEMDFKKGLLLKAFALELDANGGCVSAIDVTEHCGTRRQEWTERHVQHGLYSPLLTGSGNPHWRCGFVDNRFALSWRPAVKARYVVVGVTVEFNMERTCLMDSRVADAMFETTYEEYRKRYGGRFGGVADMLFIDEPSCGAGLYPWSASFPDEFRKDHSYDIVENLAHLAWDVDGRSPLVRAHFRETQRRLVSENYLERTRAWCERNGLLLAGHLSRTEWFSLNAAWWPDELRCYKHMDIPCCDPLGKAFGFKDTAPNHSGVKLVSSAAHLFGKRLAGSDCLAVIGDEASLRDLKGMLDYQMALGINLFIAHGFSYSIDGARKDEVPPSLFYQHAEWDYMKSLSDYVTRTCARLADSVHVCKTLVLYPSTSLAVQQKPCDPPWRMRNGSWLVLEDEKRIHMLVDDLLSAHVDFDFIDEVTLAERISHDGRLTPQGDYEAILLPYVKFISEDAAKALRRYVAGGGRVSYVGYAPEVISGNGPVPMDVSGMEFSDAASVDRLPVTVRIEGDGAEDVFAARHVKDAKPFFFLYNRSRRVFSGRCEGIDVEVQPLSGVTVDASYRQAPATGRLLDLSRGWKVEFERNRLGLGFMQVFDDADIECADYVSGKPYDLMERRKSPASPDAAKTLHRYRFMCDGDVRDAAIVMERSSASVPWRLYVNGSPVEKWRQERFYDCSNICAGVELTKSSSPRLNVVDIVTEGGALTEVPYLYGSFRCFFRHGCKSFPDISAAPSAFDVETLADWADWGYPTYSGKAVYSKTFDIAEDGYYMLSLGAVEDLAEVSIDDGAPVTLPWPPYRYVFKLKAGRHSLRIVVANASGNMFRNAGLPAGLLGPVEIGAVV